MQRCGQAGTDHDPGDHLVGGVCAEVCIRVPPHDRAVQLRPQRVVRAVLDGGATVGFAQAEPIASEVADAVKADSDRALRRCDCRERYEAGWELADGGASRGGRERARDRGRSQGDGSHDGTGHRVRVYAALSLCSSRSTAEVARDLERPVLVSAGGEVM